VKRQVPDRKVFVILKKAIIMDSTYVKPPRTILEAFQCLPEGTLAQLINNQIIMSPAPTNSHQEVLGEIFCQLLLFVKKNMLGIVRIAPFDVYLSRRNAFQPDIIFISNDNLPKLRERGFYGAPDLVIEILSPASWRFDAEDKKDEYERSGVKEYWMIDSKEKTAEGFYLSGNEFQPVASSTGTITFQLFPLTISF
jgi:Uma2 family endonuclease